MTHSTVAANEKFLFESPLYLCATIEQQVWTCMHAQQSVCTSSTSNSRLERLLHEGGVRLRGVVWESQLPNENSEMVLNRMISISRRYREGTPV